MCSVDYYHRNLDGIYTEFFGGSLRLEIFGGNLFKDVASQEIYSITREPKSLNKNP